MSKRGTKLGQRGERIAARSLEEHGYQILEKNWSCREGELDLVANQRETLVFIEVKARQSTRFGSPEESLTQQKKARLIRAAEAYLHQKDWGDIPWRIDVIAIEFDRQGQLKRLSHYESAITADEGSSR